VFLFPPERLDGVLAAVRVQLPADAGYLHALRAPGRDGAAPTVRGDTVQHHRGRAERAIGAAEQLCLPDGGVRQVRHRPGFMGTRCDR
jgi:hypothetical protein